VIVKIDCRSVPNTYAWDANRLNANINDGTGQHRIVATKAGKNDSVTAPGAAESALALSSSRAES